MLQFVIVVMLAVLAIVAHDRLIKEFITRSHRPAARTRSVKRMS